MALVTTDSLDLFAFPDELLLLVFEQLSLRDIDRLLCTCKRMVQKCWRRYFIRCILNRSAFFSFYSSVHYIHYSLVPPRKKVRKNADQGLNAALRCKCLQIVKLLYHATRVTFKMSNLRVALESGCTITTDYVLKRFRLAQPFTNVLVPAIDTFLPILVDYCTRYVKLPSPFTGNAIFLYFKMMLPFGIAEFVDRVSSIPEFSLFCYYYTSRPPGAAGLPQVAPSHGVSLHWPVAIASYIGYVRYVAIAAYHSSYLDLALVNNKLSVVYHLLSRRDVQCTFSNIVNFLTYIPFNDELFRQLLDNVQRTWHSVVDKSILFNKILLTVIEQCGMTHGVDASYFWILYRAIKTYAWCPIHYDMYLSHAVKCASPLLETMVANQWTFRQPEYYCIVIEPQWTMRHIILTLATGAIILNFEDMFAAALRKPRLYSSILDSRYKDLFLVYVNPPTHPFS